MAELTEKERKDVESKMHLAKKELDRINAEIKYNNNIIDSNNAKIKKYDAEHEKNDTELERLNGENAKAKAKPLRAAGIIGLTSAGCFGAGYLVARFVIGITIAASALTTIGAGVVAVGLVSGTTYAIASLATRKSKKKIEKQKAKLAKDQEDLKSKKDSLLLQNEKLGKENEELDDKQNKLHEKIGGYEALLNGKVKEQNKQKDDQQNKNKDAEASQKSQSDKQIRIELYNYKTKMAYPLVVDNLADSKLFFPREKKQVAYAKDFDKDDAINSYLLSKISKIGESGEYCLMVNHDLVTKNVNGKDEVVTFSVGAMNGTTKESENMRDLRDASGLVDAAIEQYKAQDEKLTKKLENENAQVVAEQE